MYALWERYQEDPAPDSAKPVASASPLFTNTSGAGSAGSKSAVASVSASRAASMKSQSNPGTPVELVDDMDAWDPAGGGSTVGGDDKNGRLENATITPAFLTGVLLRMREARLADTTRPASGRQTAVNKMLERTQAAG
jgi:cyclin C